MYSYLKKHAGSMLFMLSKAVKHQTEKGPIDVFSSEARYSLSEDRLLREKLEPTTLVCLRGLSQWVGVGYCKFVKCLF